MEKKILKSCEVGSCIYLLSLNASQLQIYYELKISNHLKNKIISLKIETF